MDVIVRRTEKLEGAIEALSSKNYTTRYLLVAALADGVSTVRFPAHSEDSDAMRRCIAELGAELEEDDEKIVIKGFGRRPKPVAELNVGNAGAVLRFLLAVAALSEDVHFVNTYPDSLGKRPHEHGAPAGEPAASAARLLRRPHVQARGQRRRLPPRVAGPEQRHARSA